MIIHYSFDAADLAATIPLGYDTAFVVVVIPSDWEMLVFETLPPSVGSVQFELGMFMGYPSNYHSPASPSYL